MKEGQTEASSKGNKEGRIGVQRQEAETGEQSKEERMTTKDGGRSQNIKCKEGGQEERPKKNLK